MKLNNAKFRVTVPTINLGDVKAKLTLLNILNAVEYALFLFFPFYILLADRDFTQLYNWISIIYLMLLVRVVKFLFFGIKAFPNIEFDLRILFVITLALISTIIQGDQQTYSNLGGTSVIGIGILMLAALSLYILVISYRNRNHNRFLYYAMNAALTLYLLKIVFSEESALELSQMNNFAIALVALMFNFMGLIYFKNRFVKLQMIIGLFVAIAAVILGMSWINFTVIVSALFLLGIFTLISRNSPPIPRKLSQFFTQSYALIALILGGISGLGVWAGYMLQDEYADFLSNILDSYLNLDVYLSDVQSIALGLSLRLYDTTLGAFAVSYGLIGLTFAVFMLMHVMGKSIKQSNQYLSVRSIFSMQFGFLASAFVMFGLMLVGRINISAFFVLIMIMVLIYAFESESYQNVKGAVAKLSNSDMLTFDVIGSSRFLNKIFKREIWQDIFSNIRLIVVIALVIFSPSIIEFIKDLF